MKQPIIYLSAWMLMASCSSDKPTYLEPHLSTLAATDITRTEATLNGFAAIEGETDMPQLYFKYGNSESLEHTIPATIHNTHDVAATLSNLTAGTTYYYMLQGSNGRTITTSNMMSLTTQPNEKPSLGEAMILSHGPMSVFIGYEITDNGGEVITETGCFYESISDEASSATGDASSEDKKPSHLAQKVALSNYLGNVGQQKLLLNNLQCNHTYRIWPYAISRAGEAICSSITYTTSNAITLHEAGDLTTLLGDNLYEYTTLTLAGPMNGDDLCCLRKMMGRNLDESATPGKLSHIDMTDVKIVAGGGSYGASRYTQDHVIGQGLFANCNGLVQVSLPMDATMLEKDAFANCTSLSKIEIPASISSLQPSSGCTALQEIQVSGANSNYKSQDGVLLNVTGTSIVWFPMGKRGAYSLPATIAAIGSYAFKGCSIEHFTLPDNITEMGQGVFMDSKVKEVKLPAHLKRLPTGTFQGCTQLKVVRLGSKAESISDYAFDLCPLTDIYVDAKDAPFCDSNAFTTRGTSFFKTCTIHVPAGRVNKYKYADDWKQFKNIVSD